MPHVGIGTLSTPLSVGESPNFDDWRKSLAYSVYGTHHFPYLKYFLQGISGGPLTS
jgi:hypothetical protein